MSKFSLIAKALAVVAIIVWQAPTHAQASRTWVSGAGDDVNVCSRISPCKTFAGAIAKTNAGGEINCLDPGGFGAVTITKSITILCAEGLPGGILLNGNGVTVNGAGISVVIEGVDIEQLNSGPNTACINIVNAANVTIHRSSIRHCKIGVKVLGSSTIRVAIKDTLILGPSGTTGVRIDANGGTRAAAVEIFNSFIGSSVAAGGNFVGLNSIGENSVARLYGSRINGVAASAGGRVLSYGNNFLTNVTTVIEQVPQTVVPFKRDHLEYN